MSQSQNSGNFARTRTSNIVISNKGGHVPAAADPDLSSLVRKAQSGDRPAFEQLLRATARIVYAQIVHTLPDRHKAEDLTQETFLAAWKNIHTVKDPAGITTWLLTLARNTLLDHARTESRLKRKTPSGPLSEAAEGEAAAPDPSPPEEVERLEARIHALQLLDDLPADYREPLKLRYLTGADYHTIRRQLNLSDGALRGLLNRGMALLRERMSNTENTK
jgi:RNA polymerase sigma-70 factor, ECF subfamily